MKLRSLRVRLLAAALISISAAVVLAAFGLTNLFEQHVERRLDADLETYLTELIGRIEPDDAGGIRLSHELADPRFDQPLSGLYWQIQDDEHHALIRSRSLWDGMLVLPHDQLALGVVHRHELAGPAGQVLMAREEQVILLPETEAHRLRFVVAIDHSDLVAAREAFTQDMLPYLMLLVVALLLAAWLQVRTGLSPLDQVRRAVQSIRSGDTRRLPDTYPYEVQPLVDEINELLDARDKAVDDARAWTADLAHGLKTPLTALSADAQRLRSQGRADMADDLEQLAQVMRRRVDRELIRARLRNETAGRSQFADLVPVVRGVVATLKRTPVGEALVWEMNVPDRVMVNLPSDDLAELLGNLLDNAGKWARSKVRVQVYREGDWQLVIDDDGPGVPAEQRVKLGRRGLRLDEQTAGTGLGLAIARDIVAAYQAKITFGESTLGGLTVSCSLPARD